ncbi:uncharacterized protein LOC111341788 [Stylophora pistillata]|uniref:uncharacterized protein LOC111341788 n=1 Tax=Stylophora pistillata TaxID=50429 RepID=UPI000C049E95|nr:uncharacterized protein LOC111341788 [Stylophora pistillata]
MGLTLGLMSLLILVFAVSNAKQALGKTHNQQELDGYSFADANIVPNQHVDKAVPRLNGKSMHGYLRHHCSQPGEEILQDQTANSPCEAGSYPCHGYIELVCKNYSFACLRSLNKYGSRIDIKCVPRFDYVTIDLGSEGERRVKRTRGCGCA